MIKEEKYYELDEKDNKVIIDGQDFYVTDDIFDLLWVLSEQRDGAIKVIDRLQSIIDKKMFPNQLN